jgi:hypothetical protein
MGANYDYYKDLCNCSEVASPGAGENGSIYQFYNEICICECLPVYLGIKDLDGDEVSAWPIKVFNVNQEELGVANDKAEFISMWNADPANQEVGRIKNGRGPFGFRFFAVLCNEVPDSLIGITQSEALGIITEDGIQITTEDGEPLITE